MRESPALIGPYVNSREAVTFERIIEESCPGKQWALNLDDLNYSALWILTAVGKVCGHQNDVLQVLDAGLELAWRKLPESNRVFD
jgi:hypothetical protein